MKNPLCDMLIIVIKELVVIIAKKKSQITHQNKENVYKPARN